LAGGRGSSQEVDLDKAFRTPADLFEQPNVAVADEKAVPVGERIRDAVPYGAELIEFHSLDLGLPAAAVHHLRVGLGGSPPKVAWDANGD
jgi:hypothetical protein